MPLTNSEATLGTISWPNNDFCMGILTSLLVWFVLKLTLGIRVSAEEEYEGVDISECGMEAYPNLPISESCHYAVIGSCYNNDPI